MDVNARKNRWRRAQNAKIREERVIAGYVEIKHPNIYKEAAGFYNMLNQKYPSKCDLRKTNEYECLKMPMAGEIIKKYYVRKSYPNIKKTVDVETHNPIKNYNDNLQLKIPLMSHNTAKTAVSTQDPTVEFTETDTTQTLLNKEIEKVMDQLREDPYIRDFFSNMPETSESTQDPPIEPPNMSETSESNQEPPIEPVEIVIGETNTIQPTLNEDLPTEVIEEIMAGLREDPHLEAYFSDIDIDIDIAENSPLEDELASW